MPSTTTTENHSLTYPAEGATGWYATWETLMQQITDYMDDITNMRMAIIKDTNGNEEIVFTATASAVNHLGITNAATGNHPNIVALGDDTNINIEIASKGSGTIELQDATNITGAVTASSTVQIDGNILDSNGNEIIEKTNTASAVNHVKISNAATGSDATIEAAGDDTNIGLTISAKGTGVPAIDYQWVPITKTTASSSASIDIVLSGSYDEYKVEIRGVRSATDLVEFLCRTSTDGGSSYDSGATDYLWQSNEWTNATSNYEQSTGDDSIMLTNQMSNSTGEGGFNGKIDIYDPSGTTYSQVSGVIRGLKGGVARGITSDFSGARASTADIDAIQFLMSSGNIAAGDFILYGRNFIS